MFLIQELIWLSVKFWFITDTINSYKQWTNDNLCNLHVTNHNDYITNDTVCNLKVTYIFTWTTCIFVHDIIQTNCSFGGKKLADFSKKCSRHISSVVGANNETTVATSHLLQNIFLCMGKATKSVTVPKSWPKTAISSRHSLLNQLDKLNNLL